MLFAVNLSLQPGETLSSITADAEDASHQHYNLLVEYAGPVPDQQWLTAVVLRLSDDLGDVGDVLVRISHQGVDSNRVRIGIGHKGGGPPDDPGAAPTPAPPYLIKGQVTYSGAGLSGVTVNLIGPQTETVVTNAGGAYQFTVLAAGGAYTISPSKTYYDFSAGPTFNNLSNNQTNVNFIATRHTYMISGHVFDDLGQGVDGVQMTVRNEAGTTVGTALTAGGGSYSFASVPAGFGYTVTGSSNFFTFTPQDTTLLTGNVNFDFNGTRRSYTIGGRIISTTGNGIVDLPISLSGARSETVRSDNSGAFSFSGLPAGRDYTLTPAINFFYTFSAQSINNLGNNQTVNLTGTIIKYSITGRITEGTVGMEGVTIRLTGSQQAMATTDSSGNYTLANVNAVGIHTVVASKTQYVFAPPSRSFINPGGNMTADFGGSFRYYVAGRVADNSGRGLAGITMTVGGSQSATSVTAGDGSYSFPLVPQGSYTVTPSIEQDWYSFGPASQSVNNLTSNQTVNFTAALAPIPNPPYVLEFDGSPKTVDYGNFWDSGVDLGHFFWEFWARPGNNAGATYLLTDGYGGAHALLFGFANVGSSEPGRYQLSGNIFNGIRHDNNFTSDQGPALGEWGHFAVGWDGQSIITYFNGVPVGKAPFTGPRMTPGPGGGGGRLLIGGSDHNNFDGRIAEVRGYEGSNPREDATGADQTLVESAFRPQNVFAVDGNLLSYYFRSNLRIADLSRGSNGSSHAGLLRSTLNGVGGQCTGCPVPLFVIDPTAPNFATGTPPTPVPPGSPAPVPSGARIFDSFSRANSTYIFNGMGGLGSTEGGAAGSKVWQTNQDISQPQPFGILNGRAVMLANAAYLTWVPTGSSSANLDIRVGRSAGAFGSGLDTGLSFRVVDDRNFFFAYTSAGSTASSPRTLTVGYYLGGQRVNLVTGVNLPASWNPLRVVTKSSGQITVYAGATQIYTTTNSFFATATGAGLYNNSSGLGLVNRWDNFTVFDAP